MTSELRLLGKTVATRHVIIRAPTAGRVIGNETGQRRFGAQGPGRRARNQSRDRSGGGRARGCEQDRSAGRAGAACVGRALQSQLREYRWSRRKSGIVSQPPVTSGQMVADLDTIVDLIDPASLYIDTSVPLSQLSLVRPGMAATVTTPFRPGHRVSRAHRCDPAELRRGQRDLVGADGLHRRRAYR